MPNHIVAGCPAVLAVGLALLGCGHDAPSPASSKTPGKEGAPAAAGTPSTTTTTPAPTPPAAAPSSSHVVFVAADGAMRVGSTAADAQPAPDVAAVAAALGSEAPDAPDAGIFYHLRVEPHPTAPAATTLVVNRAISLERVVRLLAVVPGPVALTVGDEVPSGPPPPTLGVDPAAADDTAVAIHLQSAWSAAVLLGELARAPAGDAAIAVGIDRPRGGVAGLTIATPATILGALRSDGPLAPAVIRRHVKRALSRVSYCYEKELGAHPDLEGEVTATFVIAPTGKVTDARASGVDPSVATCVAGVIGAIEFPAPTDGGSVTVTCPFTFYRGG